MRRLLTSLLLLIAACIVAPAIADEVKQNDIPYISEWPDLPTPYVTRDWQDTARKLALLTFDTESAQKHFPQSFRFSIDTPTSGGYAGPMIGVHTYLHPGKVMDYPGEAVSQLAATLTASLTDGMDPRNIGDLDYVDMAKVYYMRTENGWGFVSNNALVADCAGSFWYTLYPTILYYNLAAQYPDDAELTDHIRDVADTWLHALPNITSWDVSYYSLLHQSTINDGHSEPEGILGIAYILLMAHSRFGNVEYLQGAIDLMNEAAIMQDNPYYEILGSYGPYIAARLNAEQNAGLPLSRMLDWVFTDGAVARPGWGIINERWGDYDAYGLSGSLIDADGYAFAMNTFVTAGMLAPVARYAPEYSHDLGKYLTAVASNSHIFFANGLPLSHQDDGAYVEETGLDYLVYEGVQHHGETTPMKLPFATGDGKLFVGPESTNFSFYSSGPIGLFSSIVGDTNVPEILTFDLLKTDFEHGAAYPTYLLYNPLTEGKEVTMSLPAGGPYDVWDAVSGEYLGRNVTVQVKFLLDSDTAAQVVLMPAGAKLITQGSNLLADGIVVRYGGAWMDLPQVQEDTMLRHGDSLALDVHLMEGDQVISHQVTVAGQEILSGDTLEAPYVITLPTTVPEAGVIQITLETAMGQRISAARDITFLPEGMVELLHLEGKALKQHFQRTERCKVALEDEGLRFLVSSGESVFSLPMQLITAEDNPLLVVHMLESGAAWGVQLYVNQTAETHVLRTPDNGEGEFLFDLGVVLQKFNLERAHVKVQLVIKEDTGMEALLRELTIYTQTK